MLRTIVICVSTGLLAASSVSAQGGGRAQNSHAALQRDIENMTARLGGARLTPQQVIADAQLLSSGYRSLGPFARGFGPADYAINRDVARRSLEWLGRASVVYGRNPLVAQSFLASYDSIGTFYRDYGAFYQPGAFVAYAGATRLAQRLMLYGLEPDRFEREAARFALAYGTFAALNGALLTPWNVPHDLPDTTSVKLQPIATVHQVELPVVDAAALTAEQKAAWSDARDRFRQVAASVYQARVLMNELSQRLQRDHLSLNAQDAANALKMQSFLEDAADLMREGQFDTAIESLRRADYVRVKLKGVTGQ
jgi:hypothetical protein